MKLAGIAQVLDFDPYSIEVTDKAQAHNIGERVYDADRIFRYAVAGEALAAGYIATQPTGNTTCTTMAVLTGAIGSKLITFTNAATTTTAGDFDEGYAVISYGTGIGQSYKIESMAALVSAAASSVKLFDPIKVALDTTSKLDIVPNPYMKVLHTTGVVLHPAGVPLVAVTASGDFCWLQTRGVCGVFSHATIAAGAAFHNDETTAGASELALEATLVTSPTTGHAYFLASAASYAHPVFLTID